MEEGQVREVRREQARDRVVDVFEAAVKVGAACGAAGLIFGGAAGIIRSSTPGLFATASAIQTFGLGTTYWATRGAVLQAWTAPTHQLTSSDYIKASSIAGGVAGGSIGLLTRGRSNALPGLVVMSLFGAGGQWLYNRYEISPSLAAAAQKRPPLWRRLADWKWSPVSVLSNDEYAKMLEEKLLRIEVEIAMVDDKIAALQKSEQEQSSISDTAAAKKD